MKETLTYRAFEREVGQQSRPLKTHRKLYSTRTLISDLDIVNELDGHSGCVNALSWSKSGNLLASGSDDQHLNIHTYQSSDSAEHFRLTTTVATGHTQNIFSVKFMPHHNDRIVVTAAGDAEVRVFDLEYAGHTRAASHASTLAAEGRRRGRNNVFNGVRYLSDGDTDARVYRSHGDRVKRIVTESSPHLFLTCSEDGEVRQWDLRQPSSAYPRPRSGRYDTDDDSGSPPPLISYKRYNLDLNTISCAASQPHYIALGGAHLHALLHDRRMLRRDRLKEAGKTVSASANMSQSDEELMVQATRCVRKFAPTGQRKMKRTENGHITACKISEARPDEMIVSWSGDHIYSFDLIRTPDASDDTFIRQSDQRKTSHGSDQKRKRRAQGSDLSLNTASSRPRVGDSDTASNATLRIHYGNGQSEDIPLPSGPGSAAAQHSQALTDTQREPQRIAKAVVNIKSSLFSTPVDAQHPDAIFTKALGEAASVLSNIDEIIRSWTYPMDPLPEMVQYQKTLRMNRESTRRFVQASGTLSRTLGGKLQTPSGSSPMIAQFMSIEVRNNDLGPSRNEVFCHDFLKAILLWLGSGVGQLVEGFTRPAEILANTKAAERLPIPEHDATIEAIDDTLIPRLLSLASDRPIIDVAVNRFEVESNRQVFTSEQAAVSAFAAAVKIPFEDLSSAVIMAEGSDQIQAQDRGAAQRFWGLKVARGVLLNAAEGIVYTFVDRAFGGLGRVVREVSGFEATSTAESVDDLPIQDVQMLGPTGAVVDGINATDLASAIREGTESSVASRARDQLDENNDEHDSHVPDDAADDDEDTGMDEEDQEDDDLDTDNDEDDSSDPDEEDGVPNTGLPRFVYRSAFERRRLRERVEADVPCSSYVRKYSGHCNVRTVKDVNYFGLDDEFVVSGSDDGNFFIWDAKTSELVNLLEGDGEVVNVVQGHPYEPTLAVSGIDHTIKIFSPDARAREAARLGHGISAHDPSAFSTLSWPNRAGGRRARRSHGTTTSEPALAQMSAEEELEQENYVAPTGLRSRRKMDDAYRIMNQNDAERQDGNQDAFITLPHAQLLQMLFGNMDNAGIFSFE